MYKMMMLGFAIRVAVAGWNAFFGPSFGAEFDAVNFHNEGVRYSQNLALEVFQFGKIYSYFLGLAYWIVSDSLFFGSILSVFAWLLSAIYLRKSTKILNINPTNSFWIMAIFAVLPSSILYTSVTLREPYQLLFTTLAFYSALKIIVQRSGANWLFLLIFLAFLSVFHGALLAFSILFLGSTVVLSRRNGKSVSWLTIIVFYPMVLLMLIGGFLIFTQYAYQLDAGLASTAASYQEGGLNTEARAHYKDDAPPSGAFEFAANFPVSLVQYLFEPLPWKMSSIVDIPLFFENILRFWLIFRTLECLRQGRLKTHTSVMTLLIFSYLMMESIWSLGTVNWGTASRHHIPSLGLLLLCAFTISSKKQSSHVH